MPDANYYLPGTIQIPSALNITAISNALPMVLTVDATANLESNSYIVGQNVILNIPYQWGMWQANGLTANIVAVDSMANTISLDADSTLFDLFSNPSDGTIATLAPNGSRNLTYNNTTRNVPFQSLNNRGN